MQTKQSKTGTDSALYAGLTCGIISKYTGFLSSLSPWAVLLYTQCLKESYGNNDDKQWWCDVLYKWTYMWPNMYHERALVTKWQQWYMTQCDQIRPMLPIVTQCDSQHVSLETMILNAAVHICWINDPLYKKDIYLLSEKLQVGLLDWAWLEAAWP